MKYLAIDRQIYLYTKECNTIAMASIPAHDATIVTYYHVSINDTTFLKGISI